MTLALQIVEALHHAGTNPRVKGLITCIGDGQSFSGPAQVQELRNAVFDFRSVLPSIWHADNITISCVS